MIYQDIQITVNQGLAVPDKSLYIFRGDSNIILNFKLVTPQYMLTKDNKDNLVTRFGVDNFELRLQLEKGYDKIIKGVTTEDGCCRTQLTQNAIQELRTGTYSYQITLIDDDANAIMTFPVCKAKLNILDRMSLTAEELAIPPGLIGEAIANLSLIADDGEVLQAFDSDGNYIKTDWKSGDLISANRLDKIEDAIDKVTNNFKTLNSTKANQSDLLIERKRIDNLTKLPDGSTSGDAELIDIRQGANGILYNTAGNAVRNQLTDINNEVQEIIDALGTESLRTVEFDLVESDIVYSTYYTSGTTLVGGKSYIKYVRPGEKYLLTSEVYANDEYGLAYLFDENDKLIKTYERYTTGMEMFIDYPITIAENAVKLIVSSSYKEVALKEPYYSFDWIHQNANDVQEIQKTLTTVSNSPKEPYLIEQNRLYLPSQSIDSGGTEIGSYNTNTYSVKPGERYVVTMKTVPSNNYGICTLYDSSGYYKGIIAKNTTDASISYNNYEFTIPDEIYIIKIGYNRTETLVFEKIDEIILQVVDSVQGLHDDLSSVHNILTSRTYTPVSYDSIEENTLYNANTGEKISFNGYDTINYTVEGGATYRISTYIVSNEAYAAAVFSNELKYLGKAYPFEGSTKIEDAIITVPESATMMKCCVTPGYETKLDKVTMTPIVDMDVYVSDMANEVINDILDDSGNLAPIYVIGYQLKDNVLDLSFKCGSDKDLVIQLRCKGGNNIFDFANESFINNSTHSPSIDFKSKQVIGTFGSDWHCPYIVGAVDNPDGDNTNTQGEHYKYFTGGNHQYNNTGSGSTATGRTSSIRFFMDGREKTQGVGYANRVEIKWTNLVQGYNTTKSDGSGREILQENHTMIFDGKTFHTHVELIPLEDIIMKTWYAFQGTLTAPTYNNVKFIGGSNRGIYSIGNGEAPTCGNGKACEMIFTGPEYGLKMSFDITYDMGAYEDYKKPFAFVADYGKAYFNTTNDPTPLYANCVYCIRGTYEFFRV